MKFNVEEVWQRCMEETQENKMGHQLAGQRPVRLNKDVLSTMSGLGLGLHWAIKRTGNDLSEIDHPSYCDSLMQLPSPDTIWN